MSDSLPDISTPERSSTCNDQEYILKQAKLIRDFGIASLFLGIFLIIDLVFTIIAIIKIKNTDWGNENLNKCKDGYWITTLCCLFAGLIIIIPPIMWIVWGNKVKNTYSPKHKHNRII